MQCPFSEDPFGCEDPVARLCLLCPILKVFVAKALGAEFAKEIEEIKDCFEEADPHG